jgi:hypothetical protein
VFDVRMNKLVQNLCCCVVAAVVFMSACSTGRLPSQSITLIDLGRVLSVNAWFRQSSSSASLQINSDGFRLAPWTFSRTWSKMAITSPLS